MTLQEAKHQIATKFEYDTWDHLQGCAPLEELVDAFHQAADLYARSKWDEACEAQRQLIADNASQWLNKETFLNAPKPEFKP